MRALLSSKRCLYSRRVASSRCCSWTQVLSEDRSVIDILSPSIGRSWSRERIVVFHGVSKTLAGNLCKLPVSLVTGVTSGSHARDRSGGQTVARGRHGHKQKSPSRVPGSAGGGRCSSQPRHQCLPLRESGWGTRLEADQGRHALRRTRQRVTPDHQESPGGYGGGPIRLLGGPQPARPH